MNLLNAPTNLLTYQPHQLQSHPLKMKDKCTTDQWINWMKDVADSEIIWICSWWKIKYATLELYDHCVPIPGLHHSTFISPSRLCRQYGRPQFIVTFLPNFEGFPIRQDFLDKVKSLWPRRLLERNMHLTADVTTDDNYKAWVVMQASKPPGLSKYKRTQVLMDESQKKKQKRY